MEKISAVAYSTPAGTTVTVQPAEGGWRVDDDGTIHEFASVPQWMGYIRETHGWPLAAKAID